MVQRGGAGGRGGGGRSGPGRRGPGGGGRPGQGGQGFHGGRGDRGDRGRGRDARGPGAPRPERPGGWSPRPGAPRPSGGERGDARGPRPGAPRFDRPDTRGPRPWTPRPQRQPPRGERLARDEDLDEQLDAPRRGRPSLGPSDFAPPARDDELIPDPALGDAPFVDEDATLEAEVEHELEDELDDEVEADVEPAVEAEPAADEDEAEEDDEGEAAAAADEAEALGTISSRKNVRIRLARSLLTRRGRRREGKFLVEGVKVIREFLARGTKLEQLLYRGGVEERADVRQLLETARARGIPSHAVARALWSNVASTETSQGILAVAPLAWRKLEDLLGPVPEPGTEPPPRAVAVAAGVQDPGNLGAILRSARFLGFAGIACLSGTTDPWAPKVVRASAGALVDGPPARVEGLAELAEAARARGYELVALGAHGGSPLAPEALPRRVVLLIGAEGPGLSDAALAAAGKTLTIAAADPAAESLNAAMAFAIAAHAWRTAWGGKT